MLLPNPASVLLRWDASRWRTLSVLLRIEAYVPDSGDLELQQLVKEYLAEV
jgi:hypothetical protein